MKPVGTSSHEYHAGLERSERDAWLDKLRTLADKEAHRWDYEPEKMRRAITNRVNPETHETCPSIRRPFLRQRKSNPLSRDRSPPHSNPRSVSAQARYRPEAISWLWPGHYALGKLAIIEGDPDSGKSTLTIHLAACISAGRPLPDGSPCEIGGVVLLSAEDGAADTVRPRLDAAEADSSRVHLVGAWIAEGERSLTFPQDLPLLESAILKTRARLAVIDPLDAFLSGDVNTHKNHDIRRVLAVIASIAERTGAAIIVVRHLNKGASGKAIYRGSGSIGIIAAARTSFLVMPDPDDPSGDRRIFACNKNNIGPKPRSRAFRLVQPEGHKVARIEWLGEVDTKADELVREPDSNRSDRLDAAVGFLREALADGPVATADIETAALTRGIYERTLKRARKAMGVVAFKESDGHWYQRLPGKDGERN